MDRCRHSVYVVPADWQAQAASGVPPARRVAWYCWVCRDYESCHYSLAKLLELARAGDGIWPIRKTDSALIKNADYDDSDADILADVGEELDAVVEVTEVAAA